MRRSLFLMVFLLAAAAAGCGVRSDDTAWVSCFNAVRPDARSVRPDAKSPRTGHKGEENSGYPYQAVPESTGRIDLAVESEGIYWVHSGEAYGFMDVEGEEITPFVYDEAYPFSQGLACVSYEGKYGFINKKGETALPFIYDSAAPFAEGLGYFAIGDKYGFMDREGNPVFYLDCDSVSSFQEGMAYFSMGGTYGYIDLEGKTVIEPIYDDADYFQDGLAEIVKNGAHGMIDQKGNEIISPEYDRIERNDGFVVVQSDGLYGCFDRKGSMLLPAAYDLIFIENDLICFRTNGRAGFADREGRVIMEGSYHHVLPISGRNLAIVESNGQWGVVDCEGTVKVPLIYQWIGSGGQDNEVLILSLNGKTGCLSAEDCSELIPVKYDQIYGFINDQAVVRMGGKYGVADKKGNLKIPVLYDEIRLFDNGSMALTGRGITRLVDGSGKLIHVGIYDYVSWRGTCYEVEKGRKTGFLDETGRMVNAPVYDYVSYDNRLSPGVCVASLYQSDIRSHVIKTGENVDGDLSQILLKNMITPKMALFYEFVQHRTMGAEDGFLGYGRTYRLYGIDGSGEPALYACAEPYDQPAFPWSCSGFYAMGDNEVKELVTGSECGGSLRGDRARLWYDKETKKTMVGTQGSWGGFGGRAYGGAVYEYSGKAVRQVCSFYCVSRTSGGTEYSVNGIRATAEEFEAVYRRFK